MAQIFNFSSGPAMLPAEVLKQAQQELRDWNGLGTSVMEVSHRDKEFIQVAEEAEKDFRDLLNVPSNYKVLFCHGGGRGQFAAVPLNILGDKTTADYVDAGYWAASAIKEAKKYCTPNVFDAKVTVDGLRAVKPMREWQLSDNAAYMHYCPNETIDGIAIDETPDFGADVVVASATKFINGHGNSIGGVIVDSGSFDWSKGKFPEFTESDPSYHGLKYWESFGDLPGLGNAAFAYKVRLQLLRDLGPCLSPFNAFLFLQGLETLALRMDRHCKNAREVAEFLDGHSAVSWVNYPGLETHPSHALAKKYLQGRCGAILGFGIRGGQEAGRRFIESLELVSHLANIGDAKSLAAHPASTTHRQLSDAELASAGVTPDTIRLCIGIEHIDDILADLSQALSDATE